MTRGDVDSVVAAMLVFGEMRRLSRFSGAVKEVLHRCVDNRSVDMVARAMEPLRAVGVLDIGGLMGFLSKSIAPIRERKRVQYRRLFLEFEKNMASR